MKKSKVIIEPVVAAHLKEFYGDQCTRSLRGYAALLDGKVVGVGGISFEDGTRMLFSDMKEELRPFKRDIVRAIRVLGNLVESVRYPITAVADKKEPTAEKILTKLGFTPSGHLNPDGSKIFWRFPQWQH